MLAAWVVVFVVFAAYSAKATVDLYPSQASRVAAADAINSSQALVAVYGRVYDPSSLGALAMIKTGGSARCSSPCSPSSWSFATRAPTRRRAAPSWSAAPPWGAGRPSPPRWRSRSSSTSSSPSSPPPRWRPPACPLDGSVAFGLAWAGVGLAFAAIAAVAAQLTTSARTATAISAGDPGVRLPPARRGRRCRPGRPPLADLAVADRLGPAVPALRRQSLVGAADHRRLRRRGRPPPRSRWRRGATSGPGCCRTGADRRAPRRSLRGPLALAWRLHRGALARLGCRVRAGRRAGRRTCVERRGLPQQPERPRLHHHPRRGEGAHRRLPLAGARLRRHRRLGLRHPGRHAPARGGGGAPRRAGARHRGRPRRAGR